ncbi:MAG: hypothetical protein ACW99G_04980 [Candidatus Thorarchaeota archaeon]|jgi:hypothetical protein
MEIPEAVLDRAVEFALRYTNMDDEVEIRARMRKELESKANFLKNFGGVVTWLPTSTRS